MVLAERVVVLLLLFLAGLAQGLTVCTITCGPLVLIRIAGQERGPRQGFLSAFYFSLPRVIVMSLMGGVLGALGFGLASTLDAASVPWISPIAYMFLSLVMMATGLNFLGYIKRDTTARPGMRSRFAAFLLKLAPRKGRSERAVMFGLGLMVSVMCIGEAYAVIIFAGSALGIESSGWLTGALFGFVGMMLFSLGMVLPLMGLGTAAGSLGRKLERGDVRKVGGLLLILLGLFFLIYEIIVIIRIM